MKICTMLFQLLSNHDNDEINNNTVQTNGFKIDLTYWSSIQSFHFLLD